MHALHRGRSSRTPHVTSGVCFPHSRARRPAQRQPLRGPRLLPQRHLPPSPSALAPGRGCGRHRPATTRGCCASHGRVLGRGSSLRGPLREPGHVPGPQTQFGPWRPSSQLLFRQTLCGCPAPGVDERLPWLKSGLGARRPPLRPSGRGVRDPWSPPGQFAPPRPRRAPAL